MASICYTVNMKTVIHIKRSDINTKRRASELFVDSRFKPRIVKDKKKYTRKVKYKKDLA